MNRYDDVTVTSPGHSANSARLYPCVTALHQAFSVCVFALAFQHCGKKGVDHQHEQDEEISGARDVCNH